MATPMKGGPRAGMGPPPPVIPTSWLQPHEQRLLVMSSFGLLQAIKLWDILSPYFIPNPEPTWSSHFRVRSLTTASSWAILEISIFALISLLRIPRLSPSGPRLIQLGIATIGYNLLCWFVAEPGAFWVSLNLFGPPALGVQWYFAWWPWIKALTWKDEGHISGVHRIRLLPFSTATLNPLSLSYCIPLDSNSPIYIPVVFNNSIPSEVSYFVRSLDTGHAEVKSISGSSMKKSSHHTARLAITDADEEDVGGEPGPDPLSAMVLRENLDVARLPSIKPADSLSVVPKDLTSSEHMLFISIDRPSVVSLKSVSDKRGDRFHVAPHREAVIIECPIGGEFMDEKERKMVKKGDERQSAEQRCVGDEEVVKFQVRGVGTLRAGWKKKWKDGQEQGVIEGIEEDRASVSTDELSLVRRDKVAKTHTVPLRLKHDEPGLYTIALTSIIDSHNNTYTPSGHSAEKVFNVIARPIAKFECPSSPVQILKDKTVPLPFTVDALGGLPADVEVTYSYHLADGSQGQEKLKVGRRQESIMVSQPGTYTLLDIRGQCGGTIMEPSSCVVVLVPPPSVEMSVTTLHECAMDVGVTAAFDFTGTPPFIVEYTEQRKGTRAVARKQRFDTLHGEIVLLPEHEGSYTYSFNTLSDKHYAKQLLDKPSIEQTVHPLANIDIVGSRRQKLYACSGDNVNIELDAKGRKPLRLTYIVTGSKPINTTVEIIPGRSHISVPVPQELSAKSGNSGKFSIGLVSIEDGNGCARRLAVPSMEVEVDRVKPTGRFAKSEKVVIVEGDVAKVGMRLTGTGPWTVVYARDGSEERRVVVRDPNNQLSLEEQGTYRLLRINDAHCPGSIIDSESTFEIAYKPRPQVYIVPAATLQQRGRDFTHKGLCAEEEDQVAVRFQGEPPYELAYRHTREGHTSRHTLKSAQETGILHLATEPGSHRYDFTELRDANYASTPVAFSVSHEVHDRPSVGFVKSNSKPMCLDSALKGDANVRFQGKAPFKLGVSVRKPASSVVSTYDIAVPGHEWTMDLPHILADVGRYQVTITSLSDQSGCEWTVLPDDKLSTTVEVVESARILAVNQVEDLCVGDTLDFLLQGKAPWTIEYEWLGKKHKVTSSASRFSRYAEERGRFAVTSVALKDNQCKREITNLIRRVHPLPSVKIQEGTNDLREGDDPAAFSVHLTGTAPFSFTYTRSEVQPGGKSKVVETQTITDISTNEYTISSSLPGDYQVVAVSDRYCRYPPLKARREK